MIRDFNRRPPGGASLCSQRGCGCAARAPAGQISPVAAIRFGQVRASLARLASLALKEAAGAQAQVLLNGKRRRGYKTLFHVHAKQRQRRRQEREQWRRQKHLKLLFWAESFGEFARLACIMCLRSSERESHLRMRRMAACGRGFASPRAALSWSFISRLEHGGGVFIAGFENTCASHASKRQPKREDDDDCGEDNSEKFEGSRRGSDN